MLPHLDGMRGFFPICLALLDIIVAVQALFLLASNNRSLTNMWYRTRNLFYIGAGILYIFPIIALYIAHGTLSRLGASFGPLLLSVHIPVFAVFLNLVLSHFIGRRLNSTEENSRRQGYEDEDDNGIELLA